MNEMKKPEQWLKEFHEAIGEEHYLERDIPSQWRLLKLRMSLISEECQEVLEAIEEFDGVDTRHLAKELADLCVVTIGTADILDIPFTKVFEEVMRSNMSKIRPDGSIILRADGKVMKPESYRKADLSFLIS